MVAYLSSSGHTWSVAMETSLAIFVVVVQLIDSDAGRHQLYNKSLLVLFSTA